MGAAGANFWLRNILGNIRISPILCDEAHSNNAMPDFVIVLGALLSLSVGSNGSTGERRSEEQFKECESQSTAAPP